MFSRRIGTGALVSVGAWLAFAGACEPAQRSERPDAPFPDTALTVSQTAARDVDVGPQVVEDQPIVFLVHGLGRRSASLAPMGRGLVAAGFDVVNFGYPSWTGEADSLVAMLADSIAGCCSASTREVNFVTHSLGGILVRKYLQDYSPDHLGRVVMLAPPNGGSEIIDFVQTVPGLRALLGPIGSELGTDSTSLPNTLGPARFELGVITGDRSLNPIYSWIIPGPDDGKVSVERARIAGAEQLLVVPFSHSFIMNRDEVLEQINTFLTTGAFSQEAIAAWGYTSADTLETPTS